MILLWIIQVLDPEPEAFEQAESGAVHEKRHQLNSC
jgi:hypothetical protein